MEAETGRPLERFFERWIYGSTLPRLTFTLPRRRRRRRQEVVLRFEQDGDIFDLPVTVTLQYADRRVGRTSSSRSPTGRSTCGCRSSGPLRSVEISTDDGTLAEVRPKD